MRELLIIPHGEPMCDLLGVVGGPRGCTGLSSTGRVQVERLARRLRREADDGPRRQVLYASRRLRARQSAEVVAASLNVPVRYLAGLAERDLGPQADGRPWRLVAEEATLSGAESWPEYIGRTAGAIGTILDEQKWGRLIVIAHPDTVRASYHRFLGVPAHQPIAMEFAIDYTALTTWHGEGGRWTLISHNDTAHLR